MNEPKPRRAIRWTSYPGLDVTEWVTDAVGWEDRALMLFLERLNASVLRSK